MWSGGRLSMWFALWGMIDILENLSLYELPPPTARDALYKAIHEVCEKQCRYEL